MFGFSKEGRAVDTGFLPVEAKILAIVIFSLVLGLGMLWSQQEKKPTDNEFAFGCYFSKDGSIIRVTADGVTLGGQNDDFLIPFELEFAKGYQIALEGSVEFVVDDDAPYWTETDRGWSNLLRFVDEASLSPRSVSDPERLDTIQAVTTSSTYVLFDRMPVTDC